MNDKNMKMVIYYSNDFDKIFRIKQYYVGYGESYKDIVVKPLDDIKTYLYETILSGYLDGNAEKNDVENIEDAMAMCEDAKSKTDPESIKSFCTLINAFGVTGYCKCIALLEGDEIIPAIRSFFENHKRLFLEQNFSATLPETNELEDWLYCFSKMVEEFNRIKMDY